MRALVLLPFFVGAVGCSGPLDRPLSPVFGESFASMQAQIVPVTVSLLPPESSGARSAMAAARYEKGEQKKLDPIQATSTLKGSK